MLPVRLAPLSLLALLCVLLPGSSSGQNADAIEDCRPCPTIVLDPVATIGTPEDPVAIDPRTGVARSDDSLFVLASPYEPGLIAVYGQSGQFLRVLGREGEGPDEFRSPRVKAGPLGRLWIFDPGNGRITELLPGPELGRSFNFLGALYYNVVPLDSNRVVVSGFIPRTEQIGSRPIHVLTDTGDVLRSFGEWPNINARMGPHLSPDPRGGIWALSLNDYRLVRWSLSGRPLQVLEREPSWFQQWSTVEPDNAILLGLKTDPSGLLWVFGRTSLNDEIPQSDLEQWNQKHDIIIEVIDPVQRKVVATGHFPQAFLFPVQGSQLLYSPRQTESGYVFLDVFRASIQ